MKKIYTYTRAILYVTIIMFVFAGSAAAEMEFAEALFESDFEFGRNLDKAEQKASQKIIPARNVKNTMFLLSNEWGGKVVDGSMYEYINSGTISQKRGLGYDSKRKPVKRVKNTFFLTDTDYETPDRTLHEFLNSK